MFKSIQHIHFVGIGGSGMSGIAEVLLTLGYRVSGSDLKETDVTRRLAGLGTRIAYGHRAENIGDAQVVVTSTAVDPKNPEVACAREHKIPVIPRIEMLAELARLKYTIAVAGTHGKTTTTSMVAAIISESGLDPTFIIGGKLHHLQSGAKLGNGEYLVAEADESDGSFLKLSPALTVVTNIDNDHLDYHKTVAKLRQAFVQFANRVPFYGCTVACLDDAGVRAILPQVTRRVVTYGFNANADLRLDNARYGPEGTSFDLMRGSIRLGTLKLKLSGQHNVLNAAAAAAIGLELNIPFETIARSLDRFESVARRLEKKGEKNGVVWMDDYGHHPTEIKAVLSALRQRYPGRTIVALFQPHRYTRTKQLLKDFAVAFKDADKVHLLPIYPAGEKPIPGISSKNLCALMKKNKTAAALATADDMRTLMADLKPGAVFLTLGAGDVWKTGEKLFGAGR